MEKILGFFRDFWFFETQVSLIDTAQKHHFSEKKTNKNCTIEIELFWSFDTNFYLFTLIFIK